MRLFFCFILILLMYTGGMASGFIARDIINQSETEVKTIYVPQNCYLILPEYCYDVPLLRGQYPIREENVVEKVKEVEVIKEVPILLDDWKSTEELEQFLAIDDTDSRIILTAGPDGVVQFNGQCEDFALQLRDRAMAQGKYLSVQILHREEYHKWYGEWVPKNILPRSMYGENRACLLHNRT